MRALLLAALAAGCVETSWAQPRPRPRRDAGVTDAPAARPRDAGAPRRGRRDAAVDSAPVLRPPTHGTLPAADVQRLLRAHQTALRQCYEAALVRDATLRGDLTVRVRVEPDGTVSDTASSGEDSLRPVGQCIGAALRRVRFPHPTGGAATVVAPFVFSAGE
ncbi:MAG: AgmX/PglI C-terminal domain-containing protein [Deltaproteobacteria bacterium]|nr:AgmX/PglI C-terminal domain-containing protein [Deltaproteobacteria bacterium]